VGNFFDDAAKAFRGFDRAVIRPAAHGFRDAAGFLDKNVPGWTVLAGVLAPILPFAPLLEQAAISGATSSGVVGSAFASFAGNAIGSARLSQGVNIPTISNFQIPIEAQKDISSAYQSAAKLWASQGARAVEPLQYTLTRWTATYNQENADLGAHLEQLTIEVAQGIQLCLEVAAIALTVGGAAGFFAGTPSAAAVALSEQTGVSVTEATTILGESTSGGLSAADLVAVNTSIHIAQTALKAATTGYQVVKARELAASVRSAARKHTAAVYARMAQLDAEERTLIAQIEMIRAQRQAAADAAAQEQAAVQQDDSNLLAGVAILAFLALL
jgi:hypothetical protein